MLHFIFSLLSFFFFFFFFFFSFVDDSGSKSIVVLNESRHRRPSRHAFLVDDKTDGIAEILLSSSLLLRESSTSLLIGYRRGKIALFFHDHVDVVNLTFVKKNIASEKFDSSSIFFFPFFLFLILAKIETRGFVWSMLYSVGYGYKQESVTNIIVIR